MELPQALQNKLSSLVIKREKNFFKHLFSSVKNNKKFQIFSDRLIERLLFMIECESFTDEPSYTKIMNYGEEFKYLYLIKEG
jgi:hypothetical protein